MEKLFISFDVECDSGFGSPGTANMWEIGVVGMTRESREVFAYESLIRRRSGISGDADTHEWLKKQGLWDRYELCNENATTAPTPEQVCLELGTLFELWAKSYKLVFVARPIAYDWLFFKTYFDMYAPKQYKSLLPFKGICISSCLDTYQDIHKITDSKNKDLLWKYLQDGVEHTHRAIDDAREQANVYVKLLDLISNPDKLTSILPQ